MNSRRFLLVVVAGCCFLRPSALLAQDSAPPFAMDKPFSADVTITTKGMTLQAKVNSDGDKMRSDTTLSGMQMVSIIRKDTQKIYQIMPTQKMIMETDYDPSKFTGFSGAESAASMGAGPEGKYVPIGPETIDGVPCTKYMVTSDKTNGAFYFWLDLVRKVPVQMESTDGALMVKWKNFVMGPQDESLFEPPTDYQKIAMPALPGLTGGTQ